MKLSCTLMTVLYAIAAVEQDLSQFGSSCSFLGKFSKNTSKDRAVSSKESSFTSVGALGGDDVSMTRWHHDCPLEARVWYSGSHHKRLTIDVRRTLLARAIWLLPVKLAAATMPCCSGLNSAEVIDGTSICAPPVRHFGIISTRPSYPFSILAGIMTDPLVIALVFQFIYTPCSPESTTSSNSNYFSLHPDITNPVKSYCDSGGAGKLKILSRKNNQQL